MKFQELVAPQGIGQAQGPKGLVGKQPLVSKIVDGEHGFRGILTVRQKHRNQCGLPVVAVNDVRAPRQAQLPKCQHSSNSPEQVKPVSIVPPVFAIFILIGAVASTIEKSRAIHQPQSYRSTRQTGLPQGDIILTIPEPGFPAGATLSRCLQCSRIAGQQHLTVVAQTAECFRKAGRNIRQPPGFHERKNFTGSKQYPGHGAGLSITRPRGGSVNSTEHGRAIQGVGSACKGRGLPRLLPPYQVESELNTSCQLPPAGRPIR